MNILLDTHIVLWWLDDPSLIKEKARSLMQDGGTNIYVSVAAVWEILLKKSLGKLEIPDDLQHALDENRFQSLPILNTHAFQLQNLPDIHRDPFDRIMIAQAQCEGYTLITRDSIIAKYPIDWIEG